MFSKKPCKRYDHNLEFDYWDQIRYGHSRTLWYAGGLHPLLKPAIPLVDRKPTKQRLPFKRYVLLAPFAYGHLRDWLDIHWIRLEKLLREAGCDVVAIGSKYHEQRLAKVFGDTQAYWATNCPPDWVMDTMLGAVAYVGIDNGMTHLATLMRIKAVAIHSQLKSEFLWPKGTVKSITPNAKCVFCRWQEDRGWSNSCNDACSALASVSPETVLEAVLKVGMS
jgi:ADP-heptose:LPS heptosyltransferase